MQKLSPQPIHQSILLQHSKSRSRSRNKSKNKKKKNKKKNKSKNKSKSQSQSENETSWKRKLHLPVMKKQHPRYTPSPTFQHSTTIIATSPPSPPHLIPIHPHQCPTPPDPPPTNPPTDPPTDPRTMDRAF